jgi:hypothetical protein
MLLSFKQVDYCWLFCINMLSIDMLSVMIILVSYYIPLLDVTMIIRCMCHMLVEQHIVVPL